MMKFMVMALLVTGASTAVAQQKTLFDGPMDFGGYGGPVVRVGEFNKTAGLLVGGAGAFLIDHRVHVGLAGYGLTTVVEPNIAGGDSMRLNMGYGGGTLGYTFMPDEVVHFDVNVLVGAGGLDYVRQSTYWGAEDHRDFGVSDAFFVTEPSIGAEVNVARNVRLRLDASYRYVNGVETAGMTDKDLSGFNGGLTLKFGSF